MVMVRRKRWKRVMITNVDQGKLVETNYREHKIFKAHPLSFSNSH